MPLLFVGMVSMLPTVVNDLFQIEGGNVQVPKKLLDNAGARMMTANVTKISRLPTGAYTITSRQHAITQVHSICHLRLVPCSAFMLKEKLSHTCAGAAAFMIVFLWERHVRLLVLQHGI